MIIACPMESCGKIPVPVLHLVLQKSASTTVQPRLPLRRTIEKCVKYANPRLWWTLMDGASAYF